MRGAAERAGSDRWRPASSARAAASGTRFLLMNQQRAASVTWKIARSAASLTWFQWRSKARPVSCGSPQNWSPKNRGLSSRYPRLKIHRGP